MIEITIVQRGKIHAYRSKSRKTISHFLIGDLIYNTNNTEIKNVIIRIDFKDNKFKRVIHHMPINEGRSYYARLYDYVGKSDQKDIEDSIKQYGVKITQ